MLAPHIVGRTYHNFRGNKINDYALKSSIFIESNLQEGTNVESTTVQQQVVIETEN